MGKTQAKNLGERGLPVWPLDRPLPRFKNRREELKFWDSFDVEFDAKSWVEAPGSGGKVYAVRFDKEESARIEAIAQRRKLAPAVVVRGLVRSQLAEAARRVSKRTA